MAVTARLDGKKILADIPYDGGHGVVQAKRVPGARPKWDKKSDPHSFLGWSYPLSLDTCYALRRVFGDKLQVYRDLSDWAHYEIMKRDELEAIRNSDIAEAEKFGRLPIEAPKLHKAMRDYQGTGTAFMVAGRQTLLGDEPGLGKTIQALGAIIESGARNILVVCPRTATRAVWERETRRWAPSIATFVAQGTHTEREDVMIMFSGSPKPQRMLIINTEMIRAQRVKVCQEGLDIKFCDSRPPEARGDHRHVWKTTLEWPFLFRQKWDAIILDESHNILASTANRTSKRITQARFGAVQLRKQLIPGGLAVALSGTPFRSNLTKGWGTLNWLRPDVFGSYWRWAETYFGVETQHAGSRTVRIVGGGSKIPEPIDQDDFDRSLRPHFLARRKADVVPELPPIIYAGTPPDDDPDGPCYVRLDMDVKQARAYRQMEQDAEADIDGGRILATGVLAEITRLRQFANSYGRMNGRKMVPGLPSNKIDWIMDFMLEREGGDGKFVIASSFSEIVEMTASALRKDGWEVLTLTGATSDKDRELLQERFNDPDDPLRIVAINSKAGGEAITLDAADDMIVIDLPWTSDAFKQLRDRVHRVSRIHQVTVHRLISTGTIEEWIASLTDEQRAILERATPSQLSAMMKEAIK